MPVSLDDLQSNDPTRVLSALNAALVAVEISPEILLAAIGQTNSPQEEIRGAAVGVCERDDRFPVVTVSLLKNYLPHADGDALYWAATWLARFGETAATATAVVAGKLQTTAYPPARQRLIRALGSFGTDAKVQRPLVEQFVNDPDQQTARAAQETLAAWS